MKLFIDTETSGLPDFNQRARHPSQPHLVQFAALMLDDDWKEMQSVNMLIKPEGWTIPKEASDVHGITNEKALAEGQPEAQVGATALAMMKQAKILIAHNITFDKFLLRIAMRRFDLIQDADDMWWKSFPTFCTMRATTSICKLLGPNNSSYKWPKLSEAYKHLFNEELQGAHDAMADVRACARIYRWLHEK